MKMYVLRLAIVFSFVTAIGSVVEAANCRWCAKCNAWHCDNNTQQLTNTQVSTTPQVNSQQFTTQPGQSQMMQTIAYQPLTSQTYSQPATTNQSFYQQAIPNTTMQYAVFPLTQEYNNPNFAQEVLRLTNRYRAQYGLSPLSLSQSMGAQQHAGSMSSANQMFHGAGYTENVGYGNLNPERVVNMWMNSPTHRQNILGNYQYLDVGKSGQGWVQRFR